MQGGNLVIPLHAYPVPNQPSFPTRMDFGCVPVGDCYSRSVSLSCKVPIDAGFTIECLKPNAAFYVEPEVGVVPAGGAAEVVVTFTPSALSTQEMQIQVRWA